MKKYNFYFITIFNLMFISSCISEYGKQISENTKGNDSISVSEENAENTVLNSVKCLKVEDTTGILDRYKKERSEIENIRAGFSEKDSLNDSLISDAGNFLYKSLLNKIIPYWYGTEWDFNGYTDIPNKGQIACGYFVSTTLKHLGFNLNRFKMAQLYSLKMIESICGKENVRSYSAAKFDEMMNYLKSRNDDVYLLGLSCHTGFLSLENDTVYFIHSSYVAPLCVIKEYADRSDVLKYSSVFVIGSLFGDKEIVKKWITGKEFVAN